MTDMIADAAILSRLPVLAADCAAYANATPDTHPKTSRARAALGWLDEALKMNGLARGTGHTPDSVDGLADRCGILYRRMVDKGMLQTASRVNRAWAELTLVDR